MEISETLLILSILNLILTTIVPPVSAFFLGIKKSNCWGATFERSLSANRLNQQEENKTPLSIESSTENNLKNN